jgi:hypothetical protein
VPPSPPLPPPHLAVACRPPSPHEPSSSTPVPTLPVAPSAPASTFNPHASPFRSGGASSSRAPSYGHLDWLHYSSPSSCSSPESDGSPPCEVVGKGKAPTVTRKGPKLHGRARPRLSFMEAAQRPAAMPLGGAWPYHRCRAAPFGRTSMHHAVTIKLHGGQQACSRPQVDPGNGDSVNQH